MPPITTLKEALAELAKDEEARAAAFEQEASRNPQEAAELLRYAAFNRRLAEHARGLAQGMRF